MKKDERLRKYIDGELSGEELINFEKEINNSAELKSEINSYRNTLRHFEKIKNVKSDEYYFTNILPRFRENLAGKKRSNLKTSLAFGIVIVVLIAIIVFFLTVNKDETINNKQLTLQQVDKEELKNYLNNDARDFSTSQITEDIPEEYDSLFNSMISDELNLNGNSGEYLVDVTSNEFYNILDDLSDEELNNIYNSLKNESY